MFLRLITLFSIALLAACAAPQSYEDSLKTLSSTRNDTVDKERELSLRTGLQYANAARKGYIAPEEDSVPVPGRALGVPFSIYEYSIGNSVTGGVGLLTWFTSGLTIENRYQHIYDISLKRVLAPNTHYFSFNESPGKPTPSEVRSAWDEAFALFSALFNSKGDCFVRGWSEKKQFLLTYPKDVPGEYREETYLCPNPLFEGRKQLVMISAIANPFDNVRVVSTIQTQCYYTLGAFSDTRACGEQTANKQRPVVDAANGEWMELITTPKASDPTEFEVVSRYRGKTVTLPAPVLSDKYREFLSDNPYTANNQSL